MQFSENWLRTFVNPPLSSEELSYQLTMAGLEVEAMVPAAPAFASVVVAEILAAEKHPDADRLQVCRVNIGGAEPLQIVCGAPNARAGLKTACALVGAKLPGFEIKRAKVRGVESLGMMCSAKELGMEAVTEGILEFPLDAPVGQSVREYLDLDDQIFTLKLTPNRGDCLSLAGVAREVAAITGTDLKVQAHSSAVSITLTDIPIISVVEPAACPVYCGRIIKGIRADAATPAWMVRHLTRSGVRSISPVVDITNFVLLELGQPMHAFDKAKLDGGLTVRWAAAGESVGLLNGQSALLDMQTLVIADARGPVALAGVMGGQATAVDASTTDLLLEAAHFVPAAIAGRARRYGLTTDSAHRFERGVDPLLPQRAMDRATQLILEICGGETGPVEEVRSQVSERTPIHFRPDRARRVLGVSLTDAEMAAQFARLGLIVNLSEASWQVIAPSHRFDLNIEADLIEEVVRLRGYDQLPSVSPKSDARMRVAPESVRPVNELKLRMVARGWQEIISYSFIAPEEAEPFSEGRHPIALLNPIATQMSVMRGTLMPGLLQTLQHNLNHGQERVRIFEAGRCFAGVEAGEQPLRIGGLAYGLARPEQWGEANRRIDFYDIKSDLEALIAPDLLELKLEAHAALHPGQCARIYRNGRAMGWLGALHPRLVQSVGLAQTPILFELDLEALTGHALPQYQRQARLPAVRRDLAVLVDETTAVGEILDCVRTELPTRVVDFDLFDVYRGKGLPEGKKSLAFKMLLQDTEKTLTDAEIDALVAQILDILACRFAAVMRGDAG